MTIKSSLILICAVLFLAGCSTVEERAARLAAIDKGDQAECLNLGFKPKTNGFGNCRLKLREIRAQERTARSYNIYPNVGFGYGYNHHRW